MLKAYLLIVGSELLLPGKADTHSSYLRDRLFELGIPLQGYCVAGDDENALIAQLDVASRSACLVILTGGLGPTEDDVTRKAVARFLRKSLRYDERVREQLEQFFAERQRQMPDNNLRQALVPVGSRVLPNRVGTAPGLHLEERGCHYLLLPGPPKELEPMFAEQVAPWLAQKFGQRPIRQRFFRLTGIPESAADQIASPIYRRYPEVNTTILSKPGDIEFILTALAETGAPSGSLDRLAGELESALVNYIYSTDNIPMEEVIGRLLLERRASLSVAESCTGGLLAKRLTDVPGSSAWFKGGVVCYSNELKAKLVGVPPEIVEKYGAVSSNVAITLAAGIRHKTGTDLAVGITGIAGPGGATPEKPVGLVYIGLALGEKITVKKFQFYGDRERIRFQATQMAMEIIRRALLAKTEPEESK